MSSRLAGRQLAIMRVLWERGESTVSDLQSELDADLAYSTVATVIARMEKKGLVKHRASGRTFYYRPAVSEGRMGRSIVGDLVNRIFRGRPSQLVSHLLESDQVDADELKRIKQLIRQHSASNPPKASRRERKP